MTHHYLFTSESVACGHLLIELGRRVDGRIDGAAELTGGLLQKGRKVLEAHLPHHEEIDIARCDLLTSSDGAVHECHADALGDWPQGRAEDADEARGLCDEALELWE